MIPASMTPDRIHLRDLLDVDEDAAALHVHNRRMLLFDADAMGLLRKQLIEGLGVDAARMIIGTFGYGRGYREALAARDFYHPATFEEWWREVSRRRAGAPAAMQADALSGPTFRSSHPTI